MTRLARALIVLGSLGTGAACYAATVGDKPPPQTGATEVQPAAPPARPAVTPTGFPVLIIPGAILIGVAAAIATEDNSAEFPASTTSPSTTQ